MAVASPSKGLDLMKLFALREQFGTTFKKGDVIYSAGQAADQFYVLMKGHVELKREGFPSEVVEPGHVFGEVEVFARIARTGTATATDDANALAFTSETAENLAEATPSFALVVIRHACERLARAEQQLASGGFKTEEAAEPVNPNHFVGPGGEIGPVTSVPYAKDMYKKEQKCPNCRTTFHPWDIKSTAINAGDRDTDDRIVYNGPDPNWYIVWVCPNCQLAAYSVDFIKMTSVQLARCKDALEAVKNEDPTVYNFSFYRDEDLALRSYQLAIPFYDGAKGGAEKCASLYHRMAWIERGRGGTEKELEYLAKAADYYEQAFTSSDAAQQGVRWAYLIGDLSMRCGDYQRAVKWFTTAAAQPDFKTQTGLEKRVRDRWAEANDKLRAAKAG